MKQGGEYPRLENFARATPNACGISPKILNPVNNSFAVVKTFLPDEPRVAGRRRFDRRKVAVFRAFYAFAADVNPRGRVAVEQIVAFGGFHKNQFQKQAKQVSGGQEVVPVSDEPFSVFVRRIGDDVVAAAKERSAYSVEKIVPHSIIAIDQVRPTNGKPAFGKTLGEVSLAARAFPDVFRQSRFGDNQQISRRGFRRVVVFSLAVVRFISADCRQEKRGHAILFPHFDILSPSSMSKT